MEGLWQAEDPNGFGFVDRHGNILDDEGAFVGEQNFEFEYDRKEGAYDGKASTPPEDRVVQGDASQPIHAGAPLSEDSYAAQMTSPFLAPSTTFTRVANNGEQTLRELFPIQTEQGAAAQDARQLRTIFRPAIVGRGGLAVPCKNEGCNGYLALVGTDQDKPFIVECGRRFFVDRECSNRSCGARQYICEACGVHLKITFQSEAKKHCTTCQKCPCCALLMLYNSGSAKDAPKQLEALQRQVSNALLDRKSRQAAPRLSFVSMLILRYIKRLAECLPNNAFRAAFMEQRSQVLAGVNSAREVDLFAFLSRQIYELVSYEQHQLAAWVFRYDEQRFRGEIQHNSRLDAMCRFISYETSTMLREGDRHAWSHAILAAKMWEHDEAQCLEHRFAAANAAILRFPFVICDCRYKEFSSYALVLTSEDRFAVFLLGLLLDSDPHTSATIQQEAGFSTWAWNLDDGVPSSAGAAGGDPAAMATTFDDAAHAMRTARPAGPMVERSAEACGVLGRLWSTSPEGWTSLGSWQPGATQLAQAESGLNLWTTPTISAVPAPAEDWSLAAAADRALSLNERAQANQRPPPFPSAPAPPPVAAGIGGGDELHFQTRSSAQWLSEQDTEETIGSPRPSVLSSGEWTSLEWVVDHLNRALVNYDVAGQKTVRQQQAQCLRNILDRAFEHEQHYALFERAIPIIVKAIQWEAVRARHRSQIQSLGYDVLAMLSFNVRLKVVVAVRLGLDTLVAALDASQSGRTRSVESDTIERSACQILTNLVKDGGMAEKISRLGGMEATLALLRRSVADANHVEKACVALEYMVRQPACSKHPLAADEARRAIEYAINTHRKSPKVQSSCCNLIAYLVLARHLPAPEFTSHNIGAVALALKEVRPQDQSYVREAARNALDQIARLSAHHAMRVKEEGDKCGVELTALVPALTHLLDTSPPPSHSSDGSASTPSGRTSDSQRKAGWGLFARKGS